MVLELSPGKGSARGRTNAITEMPEGSRNPPVPGDRAQGAGQSQEPSGCQSRKFSCQRA